MCIRTFTLKHEITQIWRLIQWSEGKKKNEQAPNDKTLTVYVRVYVENMHKHKKKHWENWNMRVMWTRLHEEQCYAYHQIIHFFPWLSFLQMIQSSPAIWFNKIPRRYITLSLAHLHRHVSNSFSLFFYCCCCGVIWTFRHSQFRWNLFHKVFFYTNNNHDALTFFKLYTFLLYRFRWFTGNTRNSLWKVRK